MFVAKVGLKANAQSSDWIIDSGASRHMTFEKNVLQGYREFEASEPVGLGDGPHSKQEGKGDWHWLTSRQTLQAGLCHSISDSYSCWSS